MGSVGQNATATAAKRATKKVFKASTRILTGAKIFYNRFKHGYCHCGLKEQRPKTTKMILLQRDHHNYIRR